MTSPLAVLLIIGSAVVGPVYSKLIPGQYEYLFPDGRLGQWASSSYGMRPEDARHYCVEIGAPHPKTYKDMSPCEMIFLREDRHENLPELCERAMTETGAARDVRGHWWLFETAGTAARRSNDWNPPSEVRCIPVPTGYKR